MEVKYQEHSNKKLLIIMVILSVNLLVDISFVKINDLVHKYFMPMQNKLMLFSINSSISLLFQLILIKFVINSVLTRRLSNTPKIRAFHIISLTSFFVMAASVGLLFFQQFNYQYYETSITMLIIAISYGTSAVLIMWLAVLFFYWYKSSRDFIVLLYFISMVLIAFHLISTALFIDAKLSATQYRVAEYVGGSGDSTGGRYLFLGNAYRVSSFISFFSIWMTTAILMNSYRERLVRSVTYWIILVLPLAYFLITYFYDFFLRHILIDYFHNDPVGVSIFVAGFLSLSKPIGGLIFAIGFWNMSKLTGYEKNIKVSMMIAGWGIFFIFSANQAATQIVSPYPPFGITTITITNVAAYLLVLGIFNSASLVSVNNRLRTSVHKHASKLLSPIGRAEMEKEIEKTVTKITEDKEIAKISEGDSFEFDENELKDYLKEVINLKKKHESK